MSEPNPGSPEAVERGCTCPVIDNRHGKGFEMRGEIVFWHNGDCPLHGSPTLHHEGTTND